MSEGVDYSFARPGGAALAAAGKVFAVRYLSADGQGGKGLDASELADLRAYGIAVPVVYEGGAQGALGGFGAGAADAAVAQGQLIALGMGNLPIYFAVDFNATQAQMGAIDSYLQGAAAILGANRVGVYGGIQVIGHCQASGSASWFWQTYAWSSGKVQPGIHLYQYQNGQRINGGAVDFCRSMADEYGQTPAGTRSKKMSLIDTTYTDHNSTFYVVNGAGCHAIGLANRDQWNQEMLGYIDAPYDNNNIPYLGVEAGQPGGHSNDTLLQAWLVGRGIPVIPTPGKPYEFPKGGSVAPPASPPALEIDYDRLGAAVAAHMPPYPTAVAVKLEGSLT